MEQGNDTLSQVVTATESYVDENWRNLAASAWDTCTDIPSGFSAPSGLGESCITFNSGGTAISVEIPPQSVPFTVARLGGFTSGTVEAEATAVVVPGIGTCALCLLGPSGLTLALNGSGSMTVTDAAGSGNAGITVDSSGQPCSPAPCTPGPAATIIGGSGTISAPQIGVVGTYSGKKSDWSPDPTTGVSPVPDPLGSLPVPTPATTAIPTGTFSCTSACGTLPANTYGNISLGGGGDLTIPPGNYSSISVVGSSTLTLESGNYFFTGPFTVGGTGGASVTQDGGVMMYFTCSSGGVITACASGGSPGGSLSLSGTGNMNLDPQTTGPYAGLTVFYDRNNNSGMTLSGTPGFDFSGTIYAKDASLALNGNGGTLGSMIIVNSATVSGSGSIGINYDASQNIRPPGAPYLCSVVANNC
jgi:hypothetical protein